MTKHYYPTINMLRGMAALMVCLFHFTTHIDLHGALFPETGLTHRMGEYGILGVFVFFIITGFVIPNSLFKHDFRLNQLHRFLAKRWIRIEIPYLVSIALFLLVAFLFAVKNQAPFEIDFARLTHHIFYSASFADYEWYNPIYWTLAIEMQFYILIALLYPFFKFENRALNWLIPVAFALSALLVNDHRVVFHYGAIFSQGILLLLILKNKLGPYIGVPSILICSMITGYINGIDIAIASLVTVAAIAFFDIDKKGFNWLGDVSYSLYLIHGLVGANLIYLLGRYANDFFTKSALALTAVIFSIIAAYFYWRFVERPSKNWANGIALSNKSN